MYSTGSADSAGLLPASPDSWHGLLERIGHGDWIRSIPRGPEPVLLDGDGDIAAFAADGDTLHSKGNLVGGIIKAGAHLNNNLDSAADAKRLFGMKEDSLRLMLSV